MKKSFLLIVLLLAMLGTGCTEAKSPTPSARATARVALVAIARLVEFSMDLCASYVEQTEDWKAGQECKRILSPAKDGVYASADAVKAWETAAQQQTAMGLVACTAKAALLSFEGVLRVLKGYRIDIPRPIEDAVSWAKWGSAMALPTCNPASPTTTVKVTTEGLPPEGAEDE